jgi:hypothetical protein
MVKDEPVEAASSRNRRHPSSHGALVIRDNSPTCQHQREWTPPPEEFLGLLQAQLQSFVVMDAFAEAWSAADYHVAEEERCRRHGLIINLGVTAAGLGCNNYLPQPKEGDAVDGEDYMKATYDRLRLGCHNDDGIS